MNIRDVIKSIFFLFPKIKKIKKFVWNRELEYDSTNTNNDWVILKLSTSLIFNDDVKPACLPNETWTPDVDGNENCYVSGWGVNEEGTVFSLNSILDSG